MHLTWNLEWTYSQPFLKELHLSPQKKTCENSNNESIKHPGFATPWVKFNTFLRTMSVHFSFTTFLQRLHLSYISDFTKNMLFTIFHPNIHSCTIPCAKISGSFTLTFTLFKYVYKYVYLFPLQLSCKDIFPFIFPDYTAL